MLRASCIIILSSQRFRGRRISLTAVRTPGSTRSASALPAATIELIAPKSAPGSGWVSGAMIISAPSMSVATCREPAISKERAMTRTKPNGLLIARFTSRLKPAFSAFGSKRTLTAIFSPQRLRSASLLERGLRPRHPLPRPSPCQSGGTRRESRRWRGPRWRVVRGRSPLDHRL